jgi:hypothetical protein
MRLKDGITLDDFQTERGASEKFKREIVDCWSATVTERDRKSPNIARGTARFAMKIPLKDSKLKVF